MSVKDKCVGDIAVIKIRGELMGGEETSEVLACVNRWLAGDIRKIILDLSKVRWMNSHGIGILMACYASVSRVSGRIGICRIPDQLQQMIKISKVDTLFDQFDSVDEGLSRLRSGS